MASGRIVPKRLVKPVSISAFFIPNPCLHSERSHLYCSSTHVVQDNDHLQVPKKKISLASMLKSIPDLHDYTKHSRKEVSFSDCSLLFGAPTLHS